MTDLLLIFNDALTRCNSPPTANPALALKNIDEFLKEAYRIVSTSLQIVPLMLIDADAYRMHTSLRCIHT